MTIYKFNHNSTFPIEGLEGTLEKRIYDKLAADEKLTENELYAFMNKINEEISVPSGVMARGGWALDCRQFLNLYWVKLGHHQICEYRAQNKTILRKYLNGIGFNNRDIGLIVLIKKAGSDD